jgi:hypothetical protein
MIAAAASVAAKDGDDAVAVTATDTAVASSDASGPGPAKKHKPIERCCGERCRKKLMLLPCSCGQKFCTKHFPPSKHNCGHHSEASSRKALEKALHAATAIPSKIDKL